MTLPSTFPVARYRLDWTATAPIRLPEYAGSALRGAFGQALRQLSCVTRQKECAGCPLLSACSFPAIFAPPPPAQHALLKNMPVPAPYVVEAPDWGARVVEVGERFAFHFVLVGRALRDLPLAILAWRRALARGVGPGDGKADLVQVACCTAGVAQVVHVPEVGTVDRHPQSFPLDARDEGLESATLHFVTPLRLQSVGRALPPRDLTPRSLLMGLVRRASLLSEFHGEGPLVREFHPFVKACATVDDERHLQWRDWTRYSGRQDRRMTLGGVVGEWRLRGDLSAFAPFLRLGEILHVGKETVFGLGQYELRLGAA